uniref:Uncharacterized protein n=1 Tax=Manihot esculenta TaxID=3983 RepID=A0A2C9UU60_MANES
MIEDHLEYKSNSSKCPQNNKTNRYIHLEYKSNSSKCPQNNKTNRYIQ